MFPSNLDFLLIFKADKNVILHKHCLIMYAYTDSVGKYAMSLKLLRNTSNSGQIEGRFTMVQLVGGACGRIEVLFVVWRL